MPMSELRALGFDVFGTVVDWRSGIAAEAAPFLARHGATRVDPFAFADGWRRLYQPAMEAVRSGTRAFVRLDVLHRESLDTVLREVGLDPGRLPSAELDALTLAWHRLDPWPDVLPGLQRLKRHYLIAPLSNGNISLIVDMARRAGFAWDAILGAELARAYKPSAQVYLSAAESLGSQPAEVCLVAAHNDDLAAARHCGLATAFVARPSEHGPAQSSDLHAEQAWDLVAPDFETLAERLGA